MDSLVASLLSFLLLYKYIALFILAFASTFILPLPSNVIVLVTGVFIGQGFFRLWPSLIISVIASVLGDCFCYFIAWKYGNQVIKFFWRRGRPAIFSRIEKYLGRYAAGTIIISRLSGSPGLIVSLLAGIAPIRFRKFAICDFIGQFINVVMLFTVGYFIGIYWEKASDTINDIGLAITVAFIAFIIYRLRRKPKHQPTN